MNPGRVRRWRGARRPVSTPCPPNRTCGSPASGSPVGSCNSHTERQFGAASSHRRSPAVPVALRAPGSRKLHGFTAVPLSDAPPDLFTPLTAPSLPSVSPAPSLTHVMLRNSLPLHAGFIGKATPAGLRPLRHPSSPEAPFLDGHYPASSVLRASPPPCRPGLPLAGFRLPRARHRHGFPCCHAFHLPHVPTPLPRRKPAGALVARFPASRRPSPFLRRVGFRVDGFEACSAFTARFGPRGC